jgi:hypothetical protein
MKKRYYRNKNNVSLYKVIASLSYLFRTFSLTNPFENYELGFIINIFVGVILFPITYKIVGLFYKRRTAPALGSIMYLGFYFFHNYLLILMAKFHFAAIPVILISSIYTGVIIFLKNLKDDFAY